MKTKKHIHFILNKLIINLVIVLIGMVIGIALLVSVFCIPTYPMKVHVQQSLESIKSEFTSSVAIDGYDGSFIGNFTDSLMIESAIYTKENTDKLSSSLYVYRGESSEGDGWAPGISLVDYIDGKELAQELSYARYWHGYLIFLKPALYFTNISTLRMIAAVVQIMLVGFIVYLMGKRRENELGLGFMASITFLYFFSLYASLSLSICFYIMTVSLIFLLLYHEKMNDKGFYSIFFLLIGMTTSYFDLLTYPIITLGFPLSVCIYLNKDTVYTQFKKIIGYSLQWSFGYTVFWLSKWIITDLLVQGNIIEDAILTITQRTSAAENMNVITGFLTTVKSNLKIYTNWAFIFVIISIFLFILIFSFKNRNLILNLHKHNIILGFEIFLIGCYPFVWIFFTQNHSEIHWLFTCKIFSLTIFSFVCGTLKITQKQNIIRQ
ncbi:MAG: hypothetical protein R3Y47_02345 [Lachnospiraceae bacterium]